MDYGYKLKNENPSKKSNILSKILFLWSAKLFYKSNKIGLKIEDIYTNLECNDSGVLCTKLEKNWNQEVKKKAKTKKKPSLIRPITNTFIRIYTIYGFLHFFLIVLLKPLQPLLLGYIVRLFEKEDDNNLKMKLISATMLVILCWTISIMNQTGNYGVMMVGMQMRVAISSLIYRKILRLNQSCLSQHANQVINLLSNDVNRFDLITQSLHYLVITPFQIIICCVYMWNEVGISCLAGVVVMALMLQPLQVYLVKMTSEFRLKVAEKTDHRVKIINEVISGMKVIKMYAWEKPFKKMVYAAREAEINALSKASDLRNIYLNGQSFMDKTSLFATICCYVLLGNVPTSAKVFMLGQFFNMLQVVIVLHNAMSIFLCSEMSISIKRLEEFLLLDEKVNVDFHQSNQTNDVVLQDVDASWIENIPTLTSLNLTIPNGSLCVIVGPVGAGKSSLLHLLLGEMPSFKGKINISQDISYVSQDPWLFSSSVRNNILFGQPFIQDKYNQIVRICALAHDFNHFPDGDQTRVGERGLTLSGGQKARINLARAIYRNADVYLLDDPLSAVDAMVGKHLFDEVVVKYLRGKTRILVTHQLQYLKSADFIIEMAKGTILASGGNLDQHSRTNELLLKRAEDEVVEHMNNANVAKSLQLFNNVNEIQISGEENVTTSSLPFWKYIKSVQGICILLTLMLIFLLSQCVCTFSDYWISYWAQVESLRHPHEKITVEVITNSSKPNDMVHYIIVDANPKQYSFLHIYAVVIVFSVGLTILRPFIFSRATVQASRNLHNQMMDSLLETPIKFFHDNQSGQIVNRFFKDMGAIDEILPTYLFITVQMFLIFCGVTILIAATNECMILILCSSMVLFWKASTFYITSARSTKHLEGVAKSPVFSHLNSTLLGLTTIRSAKVGKILTRQFDELQNVHSAAWYLTIVCSVAYSLWIDLLCAVFVGLVTFTLIFISPQFEISAGIIGLAISQSLNITGLLQYGTRQSAEVVNNLTSVERVLEYTNLEKEETTPIKSDAPDLISAWPSKGKIEFLRLSFQYSATNVVVLQDINLTINSKEKIGIVGRTGAGKSSLIAALFRLAKIQGQILIDGVDTTTIDLPTLRRNISIIPQDPVLFSETIRYNLDPFYEYKDCELWNVLNEVNLRDRIPTLEYMVTEGGNNFSLGQRQLICLARAMLRKNKILVLDEATANVDLRTDGLIQSTIRKKFSECTVLTIAHRMSTIMDSDKILVIEGGRVIEFDHPHILLQNPHGYFSLIIEENGPVTAEHLRKISERNFNKKE